MAYRDDVAFIERMRPEFVRVVAEECLRARDLLRSALPRLTRLRGGSVQWRSEAYDLCRRRLTESVDLAEGLYDGYDRAGAAISDYAAAQHRAKILVEDGVAAETSLGDLIADIVTTQSPAVRLAAPLRQWNDLRSTTSISDFLIEATQRDAIDRVRTTAETLWSHASVAYDDALRVERDARHDTVARLRSAYRLMPDLRAASTLAATIVAVTPGLDGPRGQSHRIGPPTAPALRFDDDFPYDPEARATPRDYASWEKWNLQLDGARAARPDLDDATEAYAHYLEGTGTDLRVDYEEAYREDGTIRKAVDAEISAAQRDAERLYLQTGQTGFQLTGDPSSAGRLAHTGYGASTENWQKALGEHTLYGTADVEVHGDQITMRVTVHAEDRYNFNRDAADIATGAPDNDNGRFSTLGWADGFRTYGEVERTVTWTIGDPDAAAPSGGSGPDRTGMRRARIVRTDGRMARRWIVAAVVVLALAGCDGTPAADRSPTPSVTHSTTPVRTDREPITKRFPALGAFRDVHWQATTTVFTDNRVPGPSDTTIQAVVGLAETDLAAARSGYTWETAPAGWDDDVPQPLRAYLPKNAEWRHSEQYDAAVLPASNGNVYLDDAGGTVYLAAY
ncbi:hypothetical protein [Cryptosporangium japonicum]|uniref:Uncharacterized protein n=1 Tax=Cryptosporangium japonicum TaxID=80872 RepID=A0ABN0THJ8_9ACTN